MRRRRGRRRSSRSRSGGSFQRRVRSRPERRRGEIAVSFSGVAETGQAARRSPDPPAYTSPRPRPETDLGLKRHDCTSSRSSLRASRASINGSSARRCIWPTNVQRGFRIAVMARDCGDLLACGGVGLFHKRQHRQPVSLGELVVRTRALARRKLAARHRTLRAAGIELDPLTHAAARDGRTLDLCAKEFTVLEALLNASPGRGSVWPRSGAQLRHCTLAPWNTVGQAAKCVRVRTAWMIAGTASTTTSGCPFGERCTKCPLRSAMA